MLRRIAQVVAWDVRRSDHVARQGGDEFGVLLPAVRCLRQRKSQSHCANQSVKSPSAMQAKSTGSP